MKLYYLDRVYPQWVFAGLSAYLLYNAAVVKTKVCVCVCVLVKLHLAQQIKQIPA